jgi:hypothetical protein
MILKLFGFSIFLLLVLCLVFLVYWLTKDKTKALLMAVLLTGLGAGTEQLMALPLFHNSTIIASIIFLMFFYDIDQKPLSSLIIPLVIGAFIIFSDAFFIALFVVPYSIYLLVKKISDKKAIINNSVISVIFFLMTLPVDLYIKNIWGMSSKPFVLNNIANTVQSCFLSFAAHLSPFFFLTMNNTMGIIIMAISIILWLIISVILLSRLDYNDLLKNERIKYVLIMMIIPSLILIVGYILLQPLAQPRFLLYAVLFILMLLVLGYKNDRTFNICIIILLSFAFCSIVSAFYPIRVPMRSNIG